MNHKNIVGQKGVGYYARPDKHIRIWIRDDIVRAIYLTRSGDFAPLFLMTACLVVVPSDFPPLKEIFPDSITDYRYSVLAPEKQAVFLDTVRATENAELFFLPKTSIYDREQVYFEIGHYAAEHSHFIEVVNTLQPDRKTVELKLDWVFQTEKEKDVILTSKRAVVHLDHPMVVAGPVPNKDQIWLFFVTSHMQDYSSPQKSDSGPHSDPSQGQPAPNVETGED